MSDLGNIYMWTYIYIDWHEMMGSYAWKKWMCGPYCKLDFNPNSKSDFYKGKTEDLYVGVYNSQGVKLRLQV